MNMFLFAGLLFGAFFAAIFSMGQFLTGYYWQGALFAALAIAILAYILLAKDKPKPEAAKTPEPARQVADRLKRRAGLPLEDSPRTSHVPAAGQNPPRVKIRADNGHVATYRLEGNRYQNVDDDRDFLSLQFVMGLLLHSDWDGTGVPELEATPRPDKLPEREPEYPGTASSVPASTVLHDNRPTPANDTTPSYHSPTDTGGYGGDSGGSDGGGGGGGGD